MPKDNRPPLTPELKAKMQNAAADDAIKQVDKLFNDMLDDAENCMLFLATIAFAEARNEEERESVIRATACSTTSLHTFKLLIGHTPSPAREVMQRTFAHMATPQLRTYDKALREALPQGAQKRKDALEKAQPKTGEA